MEKEDIPTWLALNKEYWKQYKPVFNTANKCLDVADIIIQNLHDKKLQFNDMSKFQRIAGYISVSYTHLRAHET